MLLQICLMLFGEGTGRILSISLFLQTAETTKPLVSWETRGFVYIEFGGEGEIRTLDTVSCIHTFQACSLSHSDTSPYLGKLFSLSRRANVVESFSDGKGFFQNFHAVKLGWAFKTRLGRANRPIFGAV